MAFPCRYTRMNLAFLFLTTWCGNTKQKEKEREHKHKQKHYHGPSSITINKHKHKHEHAQNAPANPILNRISLYAGACVCVCLVLVRVSEKRTENGQQQHHAKWQEASCMCSCVYVDYGRSTVMLPLRK